MTTRTPTIDRMDVREKLAAYDDACVARETAKEAEKEAVARELHAERNALLEKHVQERTDLRRHHDAVMESINDKIRAATVEIETRYDAMPEIEEPKVGKDEPLDWGGFGDPMPRCAKSGVVLLEGDELLEDPETGAQYLRAALGLPPRGAKNGNDDDDSSEFAEPEGAAPGAMSAPEGAMT
jgi:hypothetical protein